MGTTGAMGMAEAVGDGMVGLRQALVWQLTCNHFPPLPAEWVEGAIEALSSYVDEDYDRMITLPAAGRFAVNELSVSEIVDRMHLYAFAEQMAGDDDPETYDLYNEEEVVEFEETNGL